MIQIELFGFVDGRIGSLSHLADPDGDPFAWFVGSRVAIRLSDLAHFRVDFEEGTCVPNPPREGYGTAYEPMLIKLLESGEYKMMDMDRIKQRFSGSEA